MKSSDIRFRGSFGPPRAVGFAAALLGALCLFHEQSPVGPENRFPRGDSAAAETRSTERSLRSEAEATRATKTLSFGNKVVAPPSSLDAESIVLLDERITVFSSVIERVCLWRDIETGGRVRSVQWYTGGWDGAGIPEVATEALMAADYFIVSPTREDSGWQDLDGLLAARGWTVERRHAESRVARIQWDTLFRDGLDGLDRAHNELMEALPGYFRGGWSYFFEPTVTPNDPDYPLQWAMNVLEAPAAWARTTGSPDVVVAVIDTGVDYNHPDLGPNIWRNPNEVADGTDTSGNGFVDDIRGWDFVNDTNDPRDVSTHGTGVAGVLGAVGNNSFGVAGVAWSVEMMPLAVGSANIPTERIIDAIDYAIWQRAHGGVNVVAINVSLGGRMPNIARDEETPLFLAVRRARDAGILCVFAAGNDGLDNDELRDGLPYHFFPSDIDLENVLSVAATTAGDNLYSTSNYGPESVDLAAPGHNIRSSFPGGGFSNWAGTSFAAPHVAGAIALVYAFNPDLQPHDVRRMILDTGTPLSSLETKLAHPVRLSLGGVLDEAARWPRVLPAPEWTAFPYLRSIDPAPLPVRVHIEAETVETVTFFLDDEPFAAVSGGDAAWSVSWNPPEPGGYAWRVVAASADGRAVEAHLPPVRVLHPYAFWQAAQFGDDFEEAASGFDPAADTGSHWSLAERFVFGLGTGPDVPPLVLGIPPGFVKGEPTTENETLRLHFWQSIDSLYAPLEVLASRDLTPESWEAVESFTVEETAVDPDTARILRTITVPVPQTGEPRFHRLRFDIHP